MPNIDIEQLEYDIDRLLKEENAIVEYPRMMAIKNLYENLKNAKKPKKIKEITTEIDEYFKLGIGWGQKIDIPSKELLQQTLENIQSLSIQKRKLASPYYNSSFVDKYMHKVNDFLNKNQDYSDTVTYASYEKILYYLQEIKHILDNPELLGLYEETQYSTIGKEVNFLINNINKEAKKEFIFSVQDWLPELEKEKQKCLQEKIVPSFIQDTVFTEDLEEEHRLSP